jgi:hypothetical protein
LAKLQAVSSEPTQKEDTLGDKTARIYDALIQAEQRLLDAKKCHTSQGDLYTLAAQILGMERKELQAIVYGTKKLALRFIEAEHEPMDEIDAMTRKPPSVDEKRVMDALEDQALKLSKGWERLGLNAEESQFAVSLSTMGAGNMKMFMDSAIAGCARTNVKLQAVMDRTMIRLEHVQAQLIGLEGDVNDERVLLATEEHQLSADLAGMMGMACKYMKMTIDASVQMAMVRHKQRNERRELKKAKPGFQPVGEGTEIEVQSEAPRPGE